MTSHGVTTRVGASNHDTSIPMAPSPAPPDASRTTTSDATLLRRIGRHDTAAFETFYDRHATSVHALATRIAGPQLADDVCQDVFVALWRSAGGYDDALGSPRGWLLSITRNRSIDHIRRRTRVGEHETPGDALLEVQPAPQDTDSVALRRIEADEIRGSLAVLSANQLEAVALSYVAGLTHPEIASRLCIPLGTVKGRINRGLARMRTELAPRRGELLGHAT